MTRTYTVASIAGHVAGAVVGDGSLSIQGVQSIDEAKPGQLTFIAHKRYVESWDGCRASAAVVGDGIHVSPGEGRAVIRVTNADLAMVQILHLFAPSAPELGAGIHPSAWVHPTAAVGQGVRIGPGCYVGAHTTIGRNVTLYPNVTVLDNCRIGDGTTIWPGTVVRERCEVGEHCILHPNVTIGADGFGFLPSPDGAGLVKIPHIGSVRLGNHVEVGAGTAIDRGKFGATEIGDMTKVDNLVQIGHNCRLGPGCAVAGQAGIAGSCTIGAGVFIGGQAAITDHTTVGQGARIGGRSGVIGDVPAGVTVTGFPARSVNLTRRIWAAEARLPELVRRMRGDRSES